MNRATLVPFLLETELKQVSTLALLPRVNTQASTNHLASFLRPTMHTAWAKPCPLHLDADACSWERSSSRALLRAVPLQCALAT